MDENLSRGYIQLGHNTWVDRVTRRGISAHHAKPPLDRCNCVYLALVLAGVGFLLPYNSFIIAVDYFQAKYPSTTIVFDMSLVYILVAFGAVVINNLLVETLPLHVRLSFGYLSSFATLLFVALFEVLWDAFEHDVGYTVNLVAVAVVAFGCTVQQSSFYGYTSMLPSRYTQAVMTGESAAGLLVSINRLLTKALLSDEQINTLLFFGISVVVVLLCFIIQSVVQRTRFVRFYLSLCSGNEPENDDLHKRIILEPAEDVGLVDMLDPTESKTGKYGVLSLRSPPGSPSSAGGHLVANVDSAFESSDVLAEEDSLWRHSDASSLPRTGSDDLGHLGSESHFRVQDVVVRMRGGRSYNKHVQWWSGIKRGVLARAQVARSVWPYMLSIALAYFVTLCLFPGIESEIVSCRLGSWMPVLLMALFNLSDFLGKIVASVRYDWSRSQLVWLSFARIVLVPLMALCAVPGPHSSVMGDAWAMVLSVVLGITNGVFGSLPMIVAPSRVPDEQKELTGNIMTLSYSVGLTTGSGVAYLIEYLIGAANAPSPCDVIAASTTPATSLANFTELTAALTSPAASFPSGTTISSTNWTTLFLLSTASAVTPRNLSRM